MSLTPLDPHKPPEINWPPANPSSPEIAPDPVPESRRSPQRDLSEIFRDRHRWEWSDQLGFIGGPTPKRKGRVLVLFSWAASLIDALMIAALTMIFIGMFSFVLSSFFEVSMQMMFRTSSPQLLWVTVYFLFLWIYQVSLRNLLGCTVGEWTYDLRLGQPHERLLLSYGLKVVLRSTLILATGIATLPILSLLSGRDLTGKLCGLQIFSLR